MKKIILALGLMAVIGGYAQAESTYDPARDIKEFFAKRPIGASPVYGMVKNGDDLLVVIHGYFNNQAVCMEVIEPYNRDATLSALPGEYSCVPLNQYRKK